MEQSTNWESLIAERTEAHRDSYKPQRIEDPVKRNIRNNQRIKDSTPRRKAQHKTWAQSPAGKKSMSERGKRYRATEKGKENCRKKSKKYFLRHHNDPAWREHRRELQRAWKARKKDERLKENKAA